MKNIWKVLAAVMIVALPLTISSCSSKDDDNGPWNYEYNWMLANTSLGNDATTAEKQAALNAESALNDALAKAFQAQGFTVNAAKQTFSKMQTTDAVSIWDNKAKTAAYSVKGAADYLDMVEPLPGSSRLIVRRGGDTIIEENVH
ncbi:MAG: hypothetical protein J5545_08155 [Bacteroidaceae bacterium]|nr:hypothetical protein [Bacteroidaceae bacterium]